MELYPELTKKFKTTARTAKGNFAVEITVLGNYDSDYGMPIYRRAEAVVMIDGNALPATYNAAMAETGIIRSFAVARYFGISGEIALKCDCVEIAAFINAARDKMFSVKNNDYENFASNERQRNY